MTDQVTTDPTVDPVLPEPPAADRWAVRWLVAGVTAGALVAVGVVTVAAAMLAPQPPPEAAGPVGFVDEAVAAGIDQVYDGEFDFFVGGGVAAFDCSADGRSDLFLAGGVNPAALYRNESAIGGELRFSRVTDPATDLTEVTGAYPIDIDGDAVTDLAVLRFGEDVVLRGLGDCRFERANERWGIDGGDEWTAAFSASWEGAAAWPTLAFGNYLALDEDGEHTGACSDNVLFRPGPDGYGAPTALAPGWCTLSILFHDWDRSGRNDLRMANDRHYSAEGEEQLWRIAPGEAPRPYGREDGWEQLRIWGMGIAAQDVTGDGLPEIYLTSQGDNKLQTLAAGPEQPTYTDIAIRLGVTAHRPYTGSDLMPSTAWHTEFQDVNNDGYVDLFVAKGNVDAMPDFAADDPNNLLIGQPDGTFVESGLEAGIATFARSRGAALVDLNLDGLLDIVVVNRRENVELWRNTGPIEGLAPGNWVAIRPTQDGSNRDAVGAWVEVEVGGRTIERQITVGGGHAGGQLGWIHFGLGNADEARVMITWPDGEQGPWQTVAANGFVLIERGAAEATPWSPSEGGETG